jgi:transposase
MRKIKEVLRLKHELNKSLREIKDICRIGKTTVEEYLQRAKEANVGWALASKMTEEELEKRLFPNKLEKSGLKAVKAPIPFQYIFEEIRRPNVTLSVLWEEYIRDNPNGCQYSWFGEQVKNYLGSVNYSMRQEYKAGEKAFLDFGDGINIIDSITGKIIPTEIFVFVWGASKKIYVEAVLNEDKATWISVNINAINYFGCCPKGLVPDNLKAAVTMADRYEPEINRTYEEFAEYYGTAILPARSGKPKDKPLAENGVKLAKRWFLARLRNRIFTSLPELNTAIRALLIIFNSKIMKRIGKSREELFLTLDKPNALPLPEIPYEYAEWKKAKVNINYHISFEKHEYSVPYTYIHREVDIKATAKLIEVYLKGQKLCTHIRSKMVYSYTTLKEHMPPSHQKYIEWTPDRILHWGGKYGPAVKTLVEKIISTRKYPEQAYKRCLGIIRLERHYSAVKLNAACERALRYNVLSYKGVKNILQNGLEAKSEQLPLPSNTIKEHANIRGANYFNECLKNKIPTGGN